MRPIKLKIKGLNSFMELQEIDFEKLTKKGLFGIFGPTGSGKSTILDGITLALYGEVARKSSNYMNTNCNSLNLSYEFQISEKEVKRYRVEREFKRDGKTESVRTKSAKIISIVGDVETVLEDKATLVTKKCEEIIGLKLEDFTRTVVLPQGSFSEFLRLEGKDRRTMLERLFNLQVYGDELSYKLGSKAKREREAANLLEGELNSYEDCSEAILDENRTNQEDLEEKYKEQLLFSNEADKIFDENKELWSLQNELIGFDEKGNKLKELKEQMNHNRIRVIKAEKALRVKPYLDSYKETNQGILNGNKELFETKENYTNIEEEKESCNLRYEATKAKKNHELSGMIAKEQQVKDAIFEQDELQELIKKSKIIENQLVDHNMVQNELAKTKESNDVEIKTISENIGKKENEIEALKTEEEYKEKIRIGLNILEKHENLEETNNLLEDKVRVVSIELEKNKIGKEEAQQSSNNLQELLSNADAELKELLENSPLDHSELRVLGDQLALIKAGEKNYRDYQLFLDKSSNKIMILKPELELKQKEKLQIENEVIRLDEEIKQINKENMVHILKTALAEGELCPVCGGKYHLTGESEAFNKEELEQLEIKGSKGKRILADLNEEIARIAANVSQEENNILEYTARIEELGDECKQDFVKKREKEYESKLKEFDSFNDKKAKLDNQIQELKAKKNEIDQELTKYKILLVENEKKLADFMQELETNRQLKDETKILLEQTKTELQVDDIRVKQGEIKEKEIKKGKFEKEVVSLKNSLIKKQEEDKQLVERINSIKADIIKKQVMLNENSETMSTKQKSIISKVGTDENLDEKLVELTRAIKEIEENYMKAEQAKNEVEVRYNEMKEKIAEIMAKVTSLEERFQKEKAALEEALQEEGFIDGEEIWGCILEKAVIVKLKSEIEKFDSDVNEMEINCRALQDKIGDRSLSKEQWEEIQDKKVKLEKTLSSMRDLVVTGKDNLKKLEERLTRKNKIIEEKQVIDKRIGLIDDLEKLFKGKKFVEYVATNQLKYIAVEACKKLKEITGGTYGLEVDENGKFLIRDYKNGGATRDASTLSGGETFLASLSLALALSAQIQLKGTAPLELFFLDEGFGTLDENLLEVVMDSLEKIHNDKLSVGIISHLEAIKNRIPVKLILTPAEAGMGGSKVRIEKN